MRSIDFNISLALGDERVTGYTPAYASPEHFGLDFSGSGSATGSRKGKKVRGFDVGTHTGEMISAEPSLELSQSVCGGETESTNAAGLWRLSEGSKSEKKIMPDVRSDIYCLGLTLYYLLTGKNPRISSDREPKSIEDFALEPIPADKLSAPFADILARAMEPDPEERYQSAAEMLADIDMLRYNDPRSRRLRRARAIVSAASCVIFAAGMFTSCVGIKRGDTEKTSIAHADESVTLMSNGDRAGALKEALAGLPAKNMLFAPEYLAKPRFALASAAGVYDLRGGIADTVRVKLPGIPSFVRLSPDGRTGAAVCAGKVAVFSAEDGSILAELEAEDSYPYLAEAEFIDSDTIVYAGKDCLTVYEISSGKVRFTGDRCSSVAVSADGKKVAGIYPGWSVVFMYDTADGSETRIYLGGLYQIPPAKETLLGRREAFALNADGSRLMVGLRYAPLGGSCVMLGDTAGETDPVGITTIKGAKMTRGAFAGGTYMAAAVTREKGSQLRIGDKFLAKSRNVLDIMSVGDRFFVKDGSVIDIFDAEKVSVGKFGKNRDTAVTARGKIGAFDTDGSYVLLADGEDICVYAVNGTRVRYAGGAGRMTESGLCAIRNGTAAYGNTASDELQILKYETIGDTLLTAYRTGFRHTETRISADGEHIMQFDSAAFRILDRSGNIVVGETPLPEDTADPQYRRDESGSYLEVTCMDGRVIKYDGATGAVLGESRGDPPDLEKTEFLTEKYRIVSQMHGGAEVFDRQSGKKLADLDKHDGELIYVYQTAEGLLTQYAVKEDFSDADIPLKGRLLDERFETIAEMDFLSDYDERTGTLLFDYPEGQICRTKLRSTDELIALAKDML